jgi:hypothetical protein
MSDEQKITVADGGPYLVSGNVPITSNHYWIDATAVAIVGAAWDLTHPPGNGEPTLPV